MGFFNNYEDRQKQAAKGNLDPEFPLPNGTYQGKITKAWFNSGARKSDGLEWVKLGVQVTVLTGEHKGTSVTLEAFGIEGNERSELRFWGALAVLGYPNIRPDNIADVLADEYASPVGKVVEFKVKWAKEKAYQDIQKLIATSENSAAPAPAPAEDNFPF